MFDNKHSLTNGYKLVSVQSKGKIFPIQAMKICRGSRGLAPFILNFNIRWKWVGNFTPQPLDFRNPLA